MQTYHLTARCLPKPPSQTHPDHLYDSPSLCAGQPTTPGKHILITNASHTPGPSIALSFARAGATAITLSNPTASSLTPLAAALKLINPSCRILTIACDTTRSSSVARLFSATKAAFGTLDIVVANVGSAHLGNKNEEGTGDGNDEWWDDMTTNFRSTHLPAHEYIRSFGAEGMGIFISITTGRKRGSGSEGMSWDVVKGMDGKLAEFLHGEYPGLKVFSVDTRGLSVQSVEEGDVKYMRDDAELVSEFIVWLGSGRADRLSGCCVDATRDVEKVERQGMGFLGKNCWG